MVHHFQAHQADGAPLPGSPGSPEVQPGSSNAGQIPSFSTPKAVLPSLAGGVDALREAPCKHCPSAHLHLNTVNLQATSCVPGQSSCGKFHFMRLTPLVHCLP